MAAPGWQADPAQPSESAAFKGPANGAPGGQAPVPQASVPQAVTPALPRKHRSLKPDSGRWIGAAVVVLAIALVVAVVWGAVGGTSKKAQPAAAAAPVSTATTAAGCPNPVPAGASPTAASYLNALNVGNIGWALVSTRINAEKGKVQLADVKLQTQADGVFLTALKRITFPAADVVTVSQLTTAVTAYRKLLLGDAKNFALYAKEVGQRTQIAASRGAAAGRLRTLLALPASTCSYLQP